MAADKLLAEWFWTDRWMGSSAFGLPLEARGLYREMLTQAWRRGAKLPNDHAQIRRFIGATEKEWKRAWPAIKHFWRVDGDCLINDTQVEIYAETIRRVEVNGRRAHRGAQARWKDKPSITPSNAQADAQASPQAVLKQCAPSPISDLQSPVKEKTNTARAFPVNGTTDPEIADRAGHFLELYAELYPKHRNGARFLPKPALDWPTACDLVQVWPDDRLEKLAIVFLKTDHEFASNGSRTIRQFAALASWCDDRLRQVETERAR